MREHSRVGDLQVTQDLNFTRKDEAFQRLGMAGMAGAIVAIALGLTGSGPFARTEAGNNGLTVQYDRFARRGTPTQFAAQIGGPGNGPVLLRLDGDIANQYVIEQLTPQPDRMTATPGALVLEYHVPPQAGLAVTLTVVPEGSGLRTTAFRLGEGPEVVVSQFVWF